MASPKECLLQPTRVRGSAPSQGGSYDPAAIISAANDLTLVHEPHVALALWERELSSDMLSAVNKLDLNSVDDVDLTFDVPADASTLAASLIACGYPEITARLLAADMLQLSGHLARVTGETRTRLRLEVVETDSCRKFHADYVTLRLLTTYRGPATQWVRTTAPDTIEQAKRGAVAVLKGRLLLEEPTVLHRSPPIAETGEQRLLLTIDKPRERVPGSVAEQNRQGSKRG